VVLDVVVLWDQITLGLLFGLLALGQIGDVSFYTGEDYSICPFYHPIGLRVVDRSETQLGAQVRTEFLEVGAVKLLVVVHGDFVWHTEAAHDVLPKELLYCGRSNAQQWFCFYPFGEVFHRYYSVSVIPGCCR
jgi:hypothetical protein